MNKNRATKENTNFRNWRREDSSWAILNRMAEGKKEKTTWQTSNRRPETR